MTKVKPVLWKWQLQILGYQIYLCLSLFWVTTGGAFFIRREQLKPWRDLHTILVYAVAVAAAWSAWKCYRRNPSVFFRLEPIRILKTLYELPSRVSISLVSLFFFALHLVNQWVMHQALETGLWDMGFYDQILWNTAHADFLVTSVRGGFMVFLEHFKPILALIALIYKFSDSTLLVFIVTNLIHASGFFAVYGIAKKLGLSHAWGIAFVLSLFFYQPYVNGINFLYHTQCLATPFIFWAYYLILSNRTVPALGFLMLAIASKESAIIDVFGLGCYLCAKRKPVGMAIIMLAIAAVGFHTFWIKPHFRNAANFMDHWSFHSYLLHPIRNWRLFTEPNPFFYLFKVFGPLGFLPFCTRGWYWLFGPSLIFRLLTPKIRTVSVYYTAGMDPLIYIAAMDALMRWSQNPAPQKLWRKFYSFINPAIFLLIGFCFTGTPRLFSIDHSLRFLNDPAVQRVQKFLDSVPSRYSVITTQRPAAHLSHRRHLFVFCEMLPGAPLEAMRTQADLMIIDRERLNPCETEQVSAMIGLGYQKVFSLEFVDLYWQRITSAAIPEQLTKEWEKIRDWPGVPYRRIIHRNYRAGMVFLGLILLAVIVVRMTRESWRQVLGLSLKQ